MAALELRQGEILRQLADLKKQMDTIKKNLKITQNVTTTPKQGAVSRDFFRVGLQVTQTSNTLVLTLIVLAPKSARCCDKRKSNKPTLLSRNHPEIMEKLHVSVSQELHPL